jgi:hypothetical protein
MMMTLAKQHSARLAQDAMFLDRFAEDDRLNVYAGELEVRPPGAPTTEPDPAGSATALLRFTSLAVSQ